jgi:hypothetical protein
VIIKLEDGIQIVVYLWFEGIIIINAKFWVGINLHLVNRCLLIKFDQLKNAYR